MMPIQCSAPLRLVLAPCLLVCLLISASGTSDLQSFSTYRLRLAHGSALPQDPFAASVKVWAVHELGFFGDEQCRGPPLSVTDALASVGSAAKRAELAVDSLVGTSWRATCVPGEDPVKLCTASWEQGAWIGATLASPAVVRCAAIQHSGAPAGLLLEGWSEALNAWSDLSEFGATPPSLGDTRILLRRLSGGTCEKNWASDVRDPSVTASSHQPRLLHEWAASLPVWSDRNDSSWAALGSFEPEAFPYRVQATYAGATASYQFLLPGGRPMRVYVVSQTSSSPSLTSAQGWETPCPDVRLPNVTSDGANVSLDRCASKMLYAGEVLDVPPAPGALVGIFLRHTEDLPFPTCAPRTQWRVLALENLTSWSMNELELYSDPACLDRIDQVVPTTPGSKPSMARLFNDGSSATAWETLCISGGCGGPGSLWAGLAFDQPLDVKCLRFLQARSLSANGSSVAGGAGGAGSSGLPQEGFALEVWDGQQWDFIQHLPDVPDDQWFTWTNNTSLHMWRVVNDSPIQRAWAVFELTFMSDPECQRPIEGGKPLSSDEPLRMASQTVKAFDGQTDTAWLAACSPCATSGAYIGQMFDAAKVPRCIDVTLASDPQYRPTALRLEYWANATFGWKAVSTFWDLIGGRQRLTTSWRRPGSRFAIRNSALASGGWRIAEVRFYEDPDCLKQAHGLMFSNEGDAADAARGSDSDVATFFHADCCAQKPALEQEVCSGCQSGESLLGVDFITNDTSIQCLQLIQGGVAQLRGSPMFSTERVTLLRWSGFAFDEVYTWEALPMNEWALLGVGRQRSALGSGLGCNDLEGWEKCSMGPSSEPNATALASAFSALIITSNASSLSGSALGENGSEALQWMCSTYKRLGLCNESYLEDADCGGLTMRVACRASCCLCADSNPEHCRTGVVIDDALPPWFFLVVGGGGGALLICVLISAVSWKVKCCHGTKLCGSCCRIVDRCMRRVPDVD
mmetsp:Transcript_139164/g.444651  ORF Transcript_139164/g.444651 Transcript_139164/m.444651 type:complete len:972 (-) Transcript_139164:17-2932(-)